MRPPTMKQIKKEIKKLKEMKPNVRRTSIFGDNHHDAIDAQIEVLERNLSWSEVGESFESSPDNVREAALDAAYWLEGESEFKSLTEIWESLVIKV